MLTVLDLFSGLGGFSLGLERTGGFRTVAFCEINPHSRKVLAKHWPGIPIHEDVCTLRPDRGAADVVCGGFPCQDISEAGQRRGLAGARSGLWSEYGRIIGDVRPRWVIVENVSELLVRELGCVLGDLAALGYDAIWHGIPASHVGARHIRDRVWIVGFLPDAPGARCLQCWGEQLAQASRARRSVHLRFNQPEPLRVADGIRGRTHRCTALGNAVVPQIPEIIGRAILQAEGITMTRPEGTAPSPQSTAASSAPPEVGSRRMSASPNTPATETNAGLEETARMSAPK